MSPLHRPPGGPQVGAGLDRRQRLRSPLADAVDIACLIGGANPRRSPTLLAPEMVERAGTTAVGRYC